MSKPAPQRHRLIHLGVAKVDTKGIASIYDPDETLENKPMAGLTAD